jgi:hypothetical protein
VRLVPHRTHILQLVEQRFRRAAPSHRQILFLLGGQLERENEVEQLDDILQCQQSAVVQIRRLSLMPRRVNDVVGPSPGSCSRNRSLRSPALPLSEKYLFASQLAVCRPCRQQAPG